MPCPKYERLKARFKRQGLSDKVAGRKAMNEIAKDNRKRKSAKKRGRNNG